MWYNRLSDFLHQKGYASNEDCPCVFIQRSQNGFCIISVYVYDLNIIGTPDDIEEASSYLMSEFEMKDLGKTKFCLGLQLDHSPAGIIVHQSAYTQKVLERFGVKRHILLRPRWSEDLCSKTRTRSGLKKRVWKLWDRNSPT